MEAVSAVKMRKSQQQALTARPYASGALSILQSIAKSADLSQHPLLVERPVRRTLLIVVGADKGLAGSYGSTLIKTLAKYMKGRSLTSENTKIATVGRKLNEYFSKRDYDIVFHTEHWSDKVTFNEIEPLHDKAKDLFDRGEVDQVMIIYTNFISTLKQEVAARQLLPVKLSDLKEIVGGITPKTGKWSGVASESTGEIGPIFEPDATHVATHLLPKLFSIQIYHSILEANASEHSARMIAMKNASDNAKEISRVLKLEFNKVRQAAITREVSEIVGGMESMKIID